MTAIKTETSILLLFVWLATLGVLGWAAMEWQERGIESGGIRPAYEER